MCVIEAGTGTGAATRIPFLGIFPDDVRPHASPKDEIAR